MAILEHLFELLYRSHFTINDPGLLAMIRVNISREVPFISETNYLSLVYPSA